MELKILICLFVLAVAMTIAFFFAVFGGEKKVAPIVFKLKNYGEVTEEKRNELLEKVFHLKERGFTFKQIANSLKIAESTANRYYHEYVRKQNELRTA